MPHYRQDSELSQGGTIGRLISNQAFELAVLAFLYESLLKGVKALSPIRHGVDRTIVMSISGYRVGMTIDQGREGHRVLVKLFVALKGSHSQPMLEICCIYKRNTVIY
jgi:hypothetical protein